MQADFASNIVTGVFTLFPGLGGSLAPHGEQQICCGHIMRADCGIASALDQHTRDQHTRDHHTPDQCQKPAHHGLTKAESTNIVKTWGQYPLS